MKRTLLFIVSVLASLTMSATVSAGETVEIDGIYYHLIETTKVAQVTQGPERYKGDITIPESVDYEGITYKTTIGYFSFEYCNELTSVILPKSVTSICYRAFAWCSGLTSVTFTNSVTSIDDYAFYHCSSLSSLTIPNSVTEIGEAAFEGCTGLQSIVVENGNPVYDSRDNCNAIIKTSENILMVGCMRTTIPNSVTVIDHCAFLDCTRLSSITIPSSVTKIGWEAFEGCINLTSVTIGSSANYIDSWAFQGCKALQDVYCLAENAPKTYIDAFEDTNIEKVTLHVPAASVSAYQAVEPWKNFKEIVAFSAQESDTDDSDYIPFVEFGKIWHVVNSQTGILNYHFNQYTLMNEEVVKNGKTYLKMSRREDDKDIIDDEGLYRVEDRRVYVYDKKRGREVMLYDFSLKEGDTFIYEYYFDKPVNCKVLKQGWLEDGPKIVTSRTLTPDGTMEYKYRQLRTWTIGREYDDGKYYELGTWVEGGVPGEVFVMTGFVGSMPCLAYIERDKNKCDYSENAYLPFSFYDYWGPVQGFNLPKGAADYSESDGHHQLTYELEDDRLHVHGKVFTQCGPNSYAYFIAEQIDDSPVFKLRFEIQEVEPLADCMGLFETDFYVPGFDYFINYNSVVDNQGVEHPVIKKTQQDMPYRPFVEDGKVWVVRVNSPSISPNQWTEYYYFDGDTIVGGQTCKRMMCVTNANEENWVNGVFSPANSPQQYIGAWYEQDKKVYFADNERNQFKLLYDFTLSSGDSILSLDGNLLVVNRLSGDIPGFKGTYFELCYDNYVIERWFEGVGSDSWPYLNHPVGFVGSEGILLACSVGDEVIYYNSEEGDPYVMGARKRRFDFTHTIKIQPKARHKRGAGVEQSIYGEYNDLQLGINLDPLDDAYLVRITDESGKTVYEKNVNAGNIVGLNIDISSYAEGRYTVIVENSLESFTGEFEAQPTGIKEVRSQKSEVRGQIYNLQGQRISTLQKGLNIVNGQKVFIK